MTEPLRNLVQLYQYAAEQWPDSPALGTKTAEGWKWHTRRELVGMIDRVRGGLATLTGASPSAT